jgi:glucosyl-dolichyl phosphate glucuronosyltransferase
MTGPSAAVVICAYTLDRWTDLTEAVSSAAGQAPPPDELWLVVDHNPDLLERARAELTGAHPRLRVIANQRKKGLSGARNTGLEHAGADVVVFLDDDATATEGWLAHILAPYADQDVLAVGGAAEPRWPEGEARPPTLPAAGASDRGELDWVVGCTYAGQPHALQAVRNLMGCNMSFRREVFSVVGGFSEELGRVGRIPLGCEETELCIRARAARPGAQIVFEPRALVRHHVSTDRLTWRYLRHRCYAEGISKAAVAVMVGQDRALETERSYVTRVLPRGVLREVTAAASPRGGDRLRRLEGALAIVLGLGATVLGYGRGRLSAARALRADPAGSRTPELRTTSAS